MSLRPDLAVIAAHVAPGSRVLDVGCGFGGTLHAIRRSHPGVALVGRDKPGDHGHTVAVDPATHRAFFPLQAGSSGKPVLRIMRPASASARRP